MIKNILAGILIFLWLTVVGCAGRHNNVEDLGSIEDVEETARPVVSRPPDEQTVILRELLAATQVNQSLLQQLAQKPQPKSEIREEKIQPPQAVAAEEKPQPGVLTREDIEAARVRAEKKEKKETDVKSPLLAQKIALLEKKVNRTAAYVEENRQRIGALEETTETKVVVITGFARGGCQLTEAVKQQVQDELLPLVKDGRLQIVGVRGWADKRPSTKNAALAECRAETLMIYLPVLGVDVSKITPEIGGSTDRFSIGDDGNRAVSVTVSPKRECPPPGKKPAVK